MSTFRPLAAALLALASLTASAGEALTPAQLETWADAQQAFREHRYAAAYGRFAALADAGHAPSAQMALAMFRQGPVLFGSNWAASEPQQRRWAALAADDLLALSASRR